MDSTYIMCTNIIENMPISSIAKQFFRQLESYM